MAASRFTALLFATLMVTVGFSAAPAALAQGDDSAGGAPVAPTAGPTAVREGNLSESDRIAAGVRFEENLGQTDPAVRFFARSAGATAFFLPSEIVLLVSPPESDESSGPSALRMRLAGGNAAPQITATGNLPGVTSYFEGNDPSEWIKGARSYSRITYADAYPGIDLTFYGAADGRLEYDFIVAPGADPRVIAWAIEDAAVSITDAGALALDTGAGVVAFEAPFLYQEVGGARVPVEGSYALGGTGEVRFNVGEYDATLPLVIDPVLDLAWSTYLGRVGVDGGSAIAVDAAGNAYVTGHVVSNDFPASMVNGYQATNAGGNDAFVAKYNSTGTLVYFTYLGGHGEDFGLGIAVDASLNAYVTGWSVSTGVASNQFPTTADAFQPTNHGSLPNGADAFLAKLDPTGTHLLYSTFLGGAAQDQATGVALGPNGSVSVTGWTFSNDFPTTTGAHQTGKAGGNDAFVAKFTPASTGSGLTLAWSTYLGGTANDQASGIAVDAQGRAYITGSTTSTNFPVTPGSYGAGAFQAAHGGASDAFVTELDAAGASLRYSTYLGGAGSDAAIAIAADATGKVVIAGRTASADFPVTSNAFQAALAGPEDAFIVKFFGPWTRTYSTYLGGSGNDYAAGVAFGPDATAYVVGSTSSANFPSSQPYQATYKGVVDGFVAKLSTQGGLVYATFLGGTKSDFGRGIAVYAGGYAYVTGYAESFDFPTKNPHQAFNGGGLFGSPTGDAFVAKFGPCELAAAAPGCFDPCDKDLDGTVNAPEEAACATLADPACAVDDNGNGVIDASENGCEPCDTNYDGVVSPAEQRACEEIVIYDPCDTNLDGVVSDREAAVCCHLPCDTNKDGVVDQTEAEDCEDCYHPCDEDKDGTVSEGEREACGKGFDDCDTNRDGVVDAAEKRVCAGIFEACDENMDGVVSLAELERCREKFHPCDENQDGEVNAGEARLCAERFDPCDTDRDGTVSDAETAACKGAFHACDTNMNGVIEPTERERCRNCFEECDTNLDGIVDPIEARLCSGKFHPCDTNADGIVDAAERRLCADTYHKCDTNLDGVVDAAELARCKDVYHRCDKNLDGIVDAAESLACLKSNTITSPVERPREEIATSIDASAIWAVIEGALSSGPIQERLPADVRMDVHVARAGRDALTFTVLIEERKLASVATPAEPGRATYTLSMSEPAALSILNAFERGRTAGLLYLAGAIAVNGDSQLDKFALKAASSDLGASFLTVEPYAAGTLVNHAGQTAPLVPVGDGFFKAVLGSQPVLVDPYGGRVGHAATYTGTATAAGGSLQLDERSGVTTLSKAARANLIKNDPALKNAANALMLVLNGQAGDDAFFRAADAVRGSSSAAASSALGCGLAEGESPGIFDRWGNGRSKSGFALGAASTETVKTKMCASDPISVTPIDDPPALRVRESPTHARLNDTTVQGDPRGDGAAGVRVRESPTRGKMNDTAASPAPTSGGVS